MRYLANEGKLRRVATGRYEITKKGKKAASKNAPKSSYGYSNYSW